MLPIDPASTIVGSVASESVAGAPILITGSHRSGTTWVGALLNASSSTLTIHEPFNPTYVRSWLRTPPSHWFQFVEAPLDDRWRAQTARVVDLRPPISTMLRRSGAPRNLARVGQEAVSAAIHRRRDARAVIKDPIALLAAPWIADTFGAHPIVLVRHPAAFVSSILRLGWRFDFTNLTDQPRLIDQRLSDMANEIEQAAAHPLALIDNAILSWRVLNSVVRQYRQERPEWLVVRQEDLAADPVVRVREIYERVALPWNERVDLEVRRLTGVADHGDVAPGDKGGVVRNSRAAMYSWHGRLDADQIGHIRDATLDLATSFYVDADWSPPAAE